jgi:hypothetical protein
MIMLVYREFFCTREGNAPEHTTFMAPL